MRTATLLAVAAGIACGSADATYRTRPDLSPPKLNITLPCGSTGKTCEQGYLFVSPFTTYGEPDDRVSFQAAPYILTDAGELVWSGFGYFAGWTCNLQAARFGGRDVLFSFEGSHNGMHGHGHGHHMLLGQHYDTVRVLRAGGHLVSDKHEFGIVDETTALLQIYHPLQRNLSAYGGDDTQTWIVDARFQELDIATGKVLFEWHSLDHVSPAESALPLGSGLAGVGRSSATAWDYFHINSVAKGSDGHYLLSARHASTVFKINSSDGSVIWRLGGAHSDFALGDGVRFGFQHHARYAVEDPRGVRDVVTLFDNSVYGSESAGGGHREVLVNPYSSGKYIALDHEARTATLVRKLAPPSVLDAPGSVGDTPILTKSQGSLQTLPGTGGDLVNWGSEGQITEYGADGQPVFHAFLGRDFLRTRLQNYRAFRFNWTGISPETPAVLAEVAPLPSLSGDGTDSATVRLFVSWNGDTVTAAWRFAWAEETTAADGTTVTSTVWREKVVPRRGFETSTRVPCARDVRITSVRAEALDAGGYVLGVSASVAVQQALARVVTAEHGGDPGDKGVQNQRVLGNGNGEL